MSADHLWLTMEQVDLVSNIRKAYGKRIINIESLISKLEEEVMSALAPLNPEDADSYMARQFHVRGKQTEL